MTQVRVALDLGDENEIGRFQYLAASQTRVGLPEVGERLAVDPAGDYEMEVIAVTPGYLSDATGTKIVWGRPRFQRPLEPNELWTFGFRTAWFERFEVDGTVLTAAELLDDAESSRRRERSRHNAKRTAAAIALAIIGTAAYEQRDAAEQTIRIGVDELVALLRALGL